MESVAKLPVLRVKGVGVKSQDILHTAGVHTVGELAAVDAAKVNLSKIHSLIRNAKSMLTLATSGEKNTPSTNDVAAAAVVVDTNKKEIKLEPKGFSFDNYQKAQPTWEKKNQEENKEKEEEDLLFHYLIENTSWWDFIVRLPRNGSFANAVICELSVEPNKRISFLCNWQENNQLCEMTFSPQFLFFFNTDLPVLTVHITPEDYDSLGDTCHDLESTLQEIHAMKTACETF